MADFKLGRLKFKWRGDWTTSTAYVVDDIIKYGGNTYVCVTNHTSQSTEANFYTDLNSSAYWQLHTEGLYFKGDWAGSTFYKINDLVKYGSFQYRCKLQHTSASDFAIGANWEVFSEGLQFEDSYNAGTTYQDGDVVTYGGYSYVYVNSTPQSGVTPVDGSDWNLLNPGFNATGDYNAGTAYKTGDVINFGGWVYVAIVDTTAGQNPVTNAAKWKKISEGIKWNGTYNASTTYYKGDAVSYLSSSYIAIEDGFSGQVPTTAEYWNVLSQGDPNAILEVRGDISYRDSVGAARLPLGIAGSVLTSDGTDPVWQNPETANVLYVSNTGSDANPGTAFLPLRTINYALSIATSGDVVELENLSGGTGGTPGTFDLTAGQITGGSGTGFKARIVADSSSTPTITIIDGGSGYVVGETLTAPAAQIGGGTDFTFDVKSISLGDVIYVKNGVYRENLPLRVPRGVTVQGESLRGTEIRPADGSSTQAATVTNIQGGTGGTPGTYNYVHQTSSSGSGDGIVVNVVTDGSSTPSVTIYHGGYGYGVAETITIAGSNLGSSTDLTFQIGSLENNNAANMFLVNNSTNVVQMSMKGLTGTPTAGGTGRAAITSLDPEGPVTTTSPYIQNCTSVNDNATGIQIDGNLHSSGNKSILANDFTQINSDGIGVHAKAGGRGEMVSVFTYYCDKSYYAESGGFIRGLNSSSSYGEKGAVAEGTLVNETPVSVLARGQHLQYQAATIQSGYSTADIEGGSTIQGQSSGATADVYRVNVSADTLFIENRSGNFIQGETLDFTKSDTVTTFTVDLSASFGDSTAAQDGQVGFLVGVKSTDGTLSTQNQINTGANIQFAGDSTYYRVSAVTEENTSEETALVRLTAAITTANAVEEDTSVTVTTNFSNVRLTGHDFLDIGTGGFADTNYPGSPSQPADQADEVDELTGGRVYFTSTDQKGDFRVGDLFKIEQATGVATLNADAFDLSGLEELQLGSIGAQIGATINEFSVDETLGGDSITAVPTERAVFGFLKRDKMGTGSMVPPTGTTGERPSTAGIDLFTGSFRYNTSNSRLEVYNGSGWDEIYAGPDIVEDTTPQLGGDLDTNGSDIIIDNAGQIKDDSDGEYVIFNKTASAVNQFEITNAATGSGPNLSATGDDTNVDLTLTPKGIGLVTLAGGGKVQHLLEKATVSATAATGTINFDVTTQAVLYYTTNSSANWTLNIRGDGSNTLNSVMETGESVTVAFLVTNGGTAYYQSAFQVDGSSVTPKWQGGSAPSEGNADSVDIYSITVVKTGDAAFTAFAAQTQFA